VRVSYKSESLKSISISVISIRSATPESRPFEKAGNDDDDLPSAEDYG